MTYLADEDIEFSMTARQLQSIGPVVLPSL